MNKIIFIFLCFAFFLSACKSQTKPVEKPLTKEQLIQNSIDSFKTTAANGDLILRMGDDLLSYQIKMLNDSSKLYSHAGLVMEMDGYKWVAHLAPADINADTIQYMPIDSFINPAKNLSCALYRYQMSDAEKDSLRNIISQYKSADIRFDRLYDLSTDDKMYCSEMIANGLKKATNNRILCKAILPHKKMQRIITAYFQQEKNAAEIIAKRKYIPLDRLYLMPECSLIMKLALQTSP